MPSFDVTTGTDMQEVDNAIHQARKELATRFDFKGVKWEIDFQRKEGTVALSAEDAMRLRSIVELLRERMVKRGISLKNVELGAVETGSLGSVRQTMTLAQGIAQDKAKAIVAFLKEAKLKKVQGSIQGDAVRVSGPKKDDLQAAMQALRGKDFGVELKFGNYRD